MSLLKFEKKNTVKIGGRKYPIVQIGNQWWMAENLDWKLDGIEIGASGIPSTPAAWYRNNNEETYGVNGNKLGLLYNYWCIDIINNALSKGWRVPTRNDVEQLVTAVGGEENARKLKDMSWNSGTDDYGMCIKSYCYRWGADGNFYTGDAYIATSTEDSRYVNNSNTLAFYDARPTNMHVTAERFSSAFSIRLVKDAT